MNKKVLTLWFALLGAAALYYFGSRYHYAPDAGLKDLRFKTESSSYEGIEKYEGNAVMLHFFASWCGPCMRELPVLNSSASRFSALGIDIVVLTDDDQRTIDALNNRYKLNFPVYQLEGSLRNNGVPSIPTTFILNEEGTVIYSISGSADWSDPQLIKEISSKIEK